jgi:hypothetical protein
MNTIINKSVNGVELLGAIKSCYPNALIVKDAFLINIDINDKVIYSIWLKKPNTFEVIPKKAIWNRTFEMKAKAYEISIQIKEFLESGSKLETIGVEIPINCPHCKNPNTKKIRLCEWCGYQII